MTNDELKNLCESNARAVAALTSEATEARAQRRTNADEIETLLGAVSSNETAARSLIENVDRVLGAIAESNQRFDNLSGEAIADRQTSDRRFETDRQASDQRFEAIRRESSQRFDAQLAETRAQSEQIWALVSALASTNGRGDNLEQAS